MTQTEKITNELKIRRIQQKEFCEALKIRPNTFSTWKKRNAEIPSKYIAPICNYFGWPVHEFLNEELEADICESQEFIDEPTMSGTVDESYLLLKALPDSDKHEIMQIIMKRAREYIGNMRDE